MTIDAIEIQMMSFDSLPQLLLFNALLPNLNGQKPVNVSDDVYYSICKENDSLSKDINCHASLK
jgi:hypothetical protein